MSQIRVSRRPSTNGVIALVVDHYPEDEWRRHESYRVYFDGVVKRAEQLGYHIECFFLLAPGMTASRIDRILQARGIRGLILAPPYFGNRRLNMRWSHYACVGTGYAWEQQQFDRVAHDHDQNAVLAFQNLRIRDYLRIGLVLPAFYVEGRGTRWLDGFLLCQHGIPEEQRLPPFIGSPEENSFADFKKWHAKWRPDALLTLYGHEMKWLEALHLRVPQDIGLACLIRPLDSFFAGIDDRYAEIGGAAVELTASKIGFNHYGIPQYPRLLLIDGQWIDGKSVRRRRRHS
ncbi:hypothetical protein AW736_05395 [Termitidicoccus mucosus]|uniref:LacI family transcriptional regulator n=2 Tax=Termitidicoccus mucosus TaxID=1184151 RepID=A0A178IP94_9BACT|nr:hypothetical protein AW736_05395 [Opitutaceae bacterium TSB47]